MEILKNIKKEYRAIPIVKEHRIKKNLDKFEKNMKKKKKKRSKSDIQLLEEYAKSDKTPEAELMWKFESWWGEWVIEDFHTSDVKDWWEEKKNEEDIDEKRYNKEIDEIDKMGVRAYVAAKLMYAASIRHKKMFNIKKAARIDNANKHLKYGGRRTRGKLRAKSRHRKRTRKRRKSRRKKNRKKRTKRRR